MSTATFTKIGIVEESSYGVTPAAALQLINVTGLTFGRQRNIGKPAVYTGDRRTHPSRILQKDGTFAFTTYLQYENTLLPWEGLAGASRSAAVSITAITISAASGVIADSANGLGAIDDGDWVYIDGVGISPNTADWYGPVTSAAAGAITVPATQLQNFSAGASVRIRTRRQKDGTTEKFYSAQTHITDLTSQFKSETGIMWSQNVINWKQGSYVTESWTGVGKHPTPISATIGTGADLAAPTSDFFTAVDDINSIWLANASTGQGIGDPSTLIISDLSLTIQQAVQGVYGLGSDGPAQQDLGNYDGTQLQVTARFDDTARTALSDLIQSHTTMAAAWDCVDLQGNRKLFFLPALRPDSGDETFGGPNEVISLPVTLSVHDPAKDNSSAYKSSGFGFQWAVFDVPA